MTFHFKVLSLNTIPLKYTLRICFHNLLHLENKKDFVIIHLFLRDCVLTVTDIVQDRMLLWNPNLDFNAKSIMRNTNFSISNISNIFTQIRIQNMLQIDRMDGNSIQA